LRIDLPNLVRLEPSDVVADASDASINGADDEYLVTGFKLGRQIGEGGYGRVYLATKATSVDDFEFAVKVLDPSPFVENKDEALKRFRREIRAIKKLQHRAIIPYYEAGLTRDNKPFVVMPLISGTNLIDAVRAMSLKQHVLTYVEVLRALQYAHSNNVLHRDLKPSNIVVRESDNQPIILDFGAAYILDQLDSKTLTTEAVGTIGYIPSEIIADPKVRSSLQDIYACAVMLYEGLAGRRPDPTDYRSLTEVDDNYAPLDEVIVNALASAKSRTKTAQAFADQLVARFGAE
ncbi:MAG: serine/threonine protein kinase, partial [Acidobacteria bacterium]|nr:serine/threonine protein kinase [Acidobacteriota bacterium]